MTTTPKRSASADKSLRLRCTSIDHFDGFIAADVAAKTEADPVIVDFEIAKQASPMCGESDDEMILSGRPAANLVTHCGDLVDEYKAMLAFKRWYRRWASRQAGEARRWARRFWNAQQGTNGPLSREPPLESADWEIPDLIAFTSDLADL
ncbi:hypothetical protein CBOM_06112 [Ceraceosorus bombacis]|uniref:Uncharacterized protein n=1 Tax=Ceraceosorus bombacis TaxID=401625 RepID=A0A0N7LAD1_9BASI|nr:hypothetical protein CBOM_06112 [Ceraceosorus bombacis]